VLWRRKVDTLFAAELVGDMIAVERTGALDIIDARTGGALGTTPLAGQGFRAICRNATGDLHLKTQGDLIAIDPQTGQVRWIQPSTGAGNSALVGNAVVDSWVDHATDRFGIVTYDASTGARIDTIDLGPTGGWYDVEHVELAPDGAKAVMVSAAFGVE